jgi:hypothetical protein
MLEAGTNSPDGIGNGQQASPKERAAGQSVGEAVVIAYYDRRLNGDNSRDPLIATGRVIKGKLSSRKRAGQLDIFIETRKVREAPLGNLVGAIGEFCDDSTMPEVSSHLYLVNGGFGETFINGNRVGLSALVYDGSREIDFHPVSEDEASFNGWMRVSAFLQSEETREIARQFVTDAMTSGLLARAINNFHDPRLRASALPANFSINRFCELRELKPDIVLDLNSSKRATL